MTGRRRVWLGGALALSALATGLAALPSAAQGAPTAAEARLIEALQQFIPQVMRLNNTPGLNLAIARRGEVIWEAGFGWADLERKVPMTERTVLRSGSMGKTYTATAVMQLVEQGLLGLDEPVNRYLRTFRIVNPLGGREVTVRDLLTHRAGLTGDAAGSDFAVPRPLGEYLRWAYDRSHFEPYGGTLVPLWSAQPGDRYQYSNLGIATLGYLVEVVNSERLSFSEYIQRHVIEPLGMTSTQYPPVQDSAHVRPDIYRRFSTGYARMGRLSIPTPAIHFGEYPAGNVVTVPGDHIRLLLAMMNDGAYRGRRILRPETVRLMLTPQIRNGAAGVGLVWNLTDLDTPTYRFGHGGAHMFGWTNQFNAWPGLDLAIAVSTNHWNINDDAERYREAFQISDFVVSWLRGEAAGHTPPPAATWAWKVAYVAGIIMAERTMGGLGIPTPLDRARIEAMARGTQVQPGGPDGAPWDPEGFRAGVADLLAAGTSLGAIRGFIASPALRVSPAELPLIYAELGGKEPLIPWPSYSRAQ